MPARKTAAKKRRAPAKRANRANRANRAKRAKRTKAGTKWSARVMQTSDALDLESGIFKKRSARQVALSLKKSAEASHRRKSSPFRSAMSMLNFEINRAGKGLTAERRRVLNQAKVELRRAFHRPPG
jgi:hypothetical protein